MASENDGIQEQRKKSVKNSQKPAPSRVPSRSRSPADSPFQRYMKENYFEHFRRVMSWRRAARWVLLTYPFFSSLLFAAPFAILSVVAKRLYKIKPDWFTNLLSADSEAFVMPILYGLSIVGLAFGMLTGIGLGISRARLLTFEAERTELAVRQSYFLKRIARSQRRAVKKRSEF